MTEATPERNRETAQPARRYIVDDHGERVDVILDIEEHQRLLAELEELAWTLAYDEAMVEPDEALVPLEKVSEQIESRR